MYGHECETRDREFVNQHAANPHMDALGHWAQRFECQTCDEEFLHEWECDDHMDEYDHWAPQKFECETCTREIFSQNAANQHMSALDYWGPKIPCESCNRLFYTLQEARRHMDAENHWRIHYCGPCKKGFQNPNNLRQHLQGAAHRPANSLLCPFCKQGHTTATGLTHHLETGSCPKAPNVDREFIYKQVAARDTAGVITNKQLTWQDSANGSMIANNRSFNGHYYECYLCHNGFSSLVALTQHLASPRHKQKIYHCVSRSCGKEFTTLASLFSHLESEACGATRFDNVQRSVEGILTGRRRIAF